MKIMLIGYLFVTFFGAGLLFSWLRAYLMEQKFHLSLKRAAGCVWLSLGFSVAARLLHRQVMLLGEHLIFDALGALLLAVLVCCGTALVQVLREADSTELPEKVFRQDKVSKHPAAG